MAASFGSSRAVWTAARPKMAIPKLASPAAGLFSAATTASPAIMIATLVHPAQRQRACAYRAIRSGKRAPRPSAAASRPNEASAMPWSRVTRPENAMAAEAR